jgi:hypothetical protein
MLEDAGRSRCAHVSIGSRSSPTATESIANCRESQDAPLTDTARGGVRDSDVLWAVPSDSADPGDSYSCSSRVGVVDVRLRVLRHLSPEAGGI